MSIYRYILHFCPNWRTYLTNFDGVFYRPRNGLHADKKPSRLWAMACDAYACRSVNDTTQSEILGVELAKKIAWSGILILFFIFILWGGELLANWEVGGSIRSLRLRIVFGVVFCRRLGCV